MYVPRQLVWPDTSHLLCIAAKSRACQAFVLIFHHILHPFSSMGKAAASGWMLCHTGAPQYVISSLLTPCLFAAGGSSGGAFLLTMARHLPLQGAIVVIAGVPTSWLDSQVCCCHV